MTMFPYRATLMAELAAGHTHEEIMRWIQPGTRCPVRLGKPQLKRFAHKPVAERFRNEYNERYMTTFPLSEFIGMDEE